MAKQQVSVRPVARGRVRRELEDLEALLLDDEPHRALEDPDSGVDHAAFYRWRRVRSEPPPPMGPSGSGLGRYRGRR